MPKARPSPKWLSDLYAKNELQRRRFFESKKKRANGNGCDTEFYIVPIKVPYAEGMMTTEEAAAHFGMLRATLRHAIWRGRVPAAERGHVLFVHPTDVEHYLTHRVTHKGKVGDAQSETNGNGNHSRRPSRKAASRTPQASKHQERESINEAQSG